MVKRAVEMEGTITGEHGVGIVKRDYLHYEIGEPGVNAMRRVSSIYNILYQIAFDPCLTILYLR